MQLNQGGGKEPLLWTFDRVFHGSCSQSDIFELAAKETAEDVIRGYNGTIFAYGQVRPKPSNDPFYFRLSVASFWPYFAHVPAHQRHNTLSFHSALCLLSFLY